MAVVLGLPLLIPVAHLTDYQYGTVAGLTVYAVPQVLAATLPVSATSGDVGTLVKLLRVLLLGPLLLGFALLRERPPGQPPFDGPRPAVENRRPLAAPGGCACRSSCSSPRRRPASAATTAC